MASPRFTEEEFRQRAAAGLLREAPETSRRSDDDLNPDARMIPEGGTPRPAAVLVPVLRRNPELTVLLTQRTAHLAKHAGQIAFPGGRLDHDGESPLDAALREAEEETGLHRRFVEPIGYLDGYRTSTNYHVVPVVALVSEGFSLSPQTEEVADIFEVPLRFLMTPTHHQRHARAWQGKERHYYAMPYGERYIWGATAGMLRNLYDRLYQDAHD